jgi:hypothetical protein
MSLTAAEIVVCNQALDKFGASNFTYARQTSNEAVKCNLHYSQTRDALLRSFEWNFASARSQLVILKTLTLDLSPMSDAWSVGTAITGITSYATATILSVVSATEYEISYLDGDFTDGEKITDGDVEEVFWEGQNLYWEDEIILWWNGGNDIVCGTGYPIVANITPDFGYDYQFVLPADFSRFKKHWRRRFQHWTIEGNRLLTDDDSVNAEYIKKITDPADFDTLFTEVLILQLALKLLHPIAGAGNEALELKTGLQRELAGVMERAKAVCRAETNDTGRSDWNLVRYGSGKITPSRSATSG